MVLASAAFASAAAAALCASIALICTSVARQQAVPIRKITVELPTDEAKALAQLVKRLGYDDAERLSSQYDGGEERDAMLSGIDKLRRVLAEAGFAPR
jgi:hypothetical protein